DGDREVLRVASWQLRGSPDSADPALLFAAAERASALGHPETAVRFAEAAIDRGAGPVAAPWLADALYFAGRFDEVEAVVDRCALDPGAPAGVRRLVATPRSSPRCGGRGGPAPALAPLEASLEHLEPADRQEIEAHHASICFFAGAVGDTIDRLEPLL